MATRVHRTGKEILANFKNNVHLMKDLKALNAFVHETLNESEKNIEKAVQRSRAGKQLWWEGKMKNF